ncbi:mechanosensitive ion channel family protein, partial [Patescibacteria group bacterium]
LLVFKVFQFYILRRLKKVAERTKTDADDTLISVVQSLRPRFYYFLAFYLATYSIVLSDLVKNIIEGILIILVVYQVIIASQVIIDYILEKKAGEKEDLETKTAIKNISGLIKFVLWVLGLMLILSNLGVNITSLIAGLGVGGIAIAFAMQNILSDLFSSFAIYFDKPFKVGDFIMMGTDAGTVEKIGIKTTRIRTSQGEELVVSNQELTSARIQNFKKMEERRGVFGFGVAYETSVSKVREIPNDIKQIIESIDGVRFDRAHFKSFGESNLDFEVVYYVNTSEYGKFMDIQQEINLKIMEKFEEKGIEMAYPTRTLYMKREI